MPVKSTRQRLLTYDRMSLSPLTVEQLTVVRMFVKTAGWSPSALDQWVSKALAVEETRKKEASKGLEASSLKKHKK